MCIRDRVREKFEKYDIDQSGILSREEVRAMLTDLNDGIPVSDEELRAVSKAASKFRCGSLDKSGVCKIDYQKSYENIYRFFFQNSFDFFENFSFVSFFKKKSRNRSRRDDSFGPLIVEFRAILAIVRPFEDFYWLG